MFKNTASNRNRSMSSLIIIWSKVFFNETFLDLVNAISADFLVARNEIYASFLAR